RDAQPHNVVQERLAASQFFLQHSVTAPDGNTEGLPTAIQEAMASGTVVLSTRHAGIPEAVKEGLTGLLVDEHDEAGFSEGIRTLLSGTLDVVAMAKQARADAEANLDNRMLVQKLEKVIQDTVSKS
ncbi:MAG: glycosyltransferase, partial [Pseudomonadota bacterium]